METDSNLTQSSMYISPPRITQKLSQVEKIPVKYEVPATHCFYLKMLF